MSAAGSGSRARTREIGYGEGAKEIGYLLLDEAERWRNTAEQQIGAEIRAALKVAADELRRIGYLALDVSMVHLHERGDFAGEAEHFEYCVTKGWRPAPRREPPWTEQSSN